MIEEERVDPRTTEILKVFSAREQLMMIIVSTKVVGEAIVSIFSPAHPRQPSETVAYHPRYQLSVEGLFNLLVPSEHDLRRGIAYQTMKTRVLNPKFSVNPGIRAVQNERVTYVARLIVRLTGKPVEVRFQEATGRNFAYLDKGVVRG
jgi:hypothetical protein